ncbi:hypothetical protein COLO4_34411 [Corchorus olitorius]|uniref:Uncharacterized protein n=1 Tax=Corchorus olitorius TaxID=93759 RepID=A0A1R3GKX0_9ROSI|nr:hypothetical protein COLO4_34411 [Corchorus olitorius]
MPDITISSGLIPFLCRVHLRNRLDFIRYPFWRDTTRFGVFSAYQKNVCSWNHPLSSNERAYANMSYGAKAGLKLDHKKEVRKFSLAEDLKELGRGFFSMVTWITNGTCDLRRIREARGWLNRYRLKEGEIRLPDRRPNLWFRFLVLSPFYRHLILILSDVRRKANANVDDKISLSPMLERKPSTVPKEDAKKETQKSVLGGYRLFFEQIKAEVRPIGTSLVNLFVSGKCAISYLGFTLRAGGLSRDQFGNLLAGFRRKLGTSTSLASELWAIRDRLQLIQQEQLKQMKFLLPTWSLSHERSYCPLRVLIPP